MLILCPQFDVMHNHLDSKIRRLAEVMGAWEQCHLRRLEEPVSHPELQFISQIRVNVNMSAIAGQTIQVWMQMTDCLTGQVSLFRHICTLFTELLIVLQVNN